MKFHTFELLWKKKKNKKNRQKKIPFLSSCGHNGDDLQRGTCTFSYFFFEYITVMCVRLIWRWVIDLHQGINRSFLFQGQKNEKLLFEKGVPFCVEYVESLFFVENSNTYFRTLGRNIPVQSLVEYPHHLMHPPGISFILRYHKEPRTALTPQTRPPVKN